MVPSRRRTGLPCALEDVIRCCARQMCWIHWPHCWGSQNTWYAPEKNEKGGKTLHGHTCSLRKSKSTCAEAPCEVPLSRLFRPFEKLKARWNSLTSGDSISSVFLAHSGSGATSTCRPPAWSVSRHLQPLKDHLPCEVLKACTVN